MDDNAQFPEERDSQKQDLLIERLAESERRYNVIVNNLSSIVFECDPSGKLTYVNPAWERLLGYSSADTLSKPIEDYIYIKDQSFWHNLLNEFIVAESGHKWTIRMVDVQHNLHWFDISLDRNELGELTGMLSDITEHVELVEHIRQLNETLEQRVADRTRDLVLSAEVSKRITSALNLDEVLSQVVNLTKDSFDLNYVAIYLKKSEHEGLHFERDTSPEETWTGGVLRSFALTEQGLVSKAARAGKLMLRNKSTHSADCATRRFLPETQSELSLPMRIGNELVGVLDLHSARQDRFQPEDIAVLASLADQIAISVRNAQLFEENRRAIAMAEHANQVKSKFLASVSHELRTPLNSILNFSAFVVHGRVGEVNSRQVEMLNYVISSGTHLLMLINDVLDISKIEADALVLFVENDISIPNEVQKVVKTASGLLEGKPVTLRYVIAGNIPRIKGDRQRIFQIVLNLVSNACKFTEEGEIVITVSCREDAIVISVADPGPGIALEDQEAIFELFTQTKSGIKKGGTGLGLAISRRLAEAMHGKLWLDSAPGQGSTFYVSLPVETP